MEKEKYYNVELKHELKLLELLNLSLVNDGILNKWLNGEKISGTESLVKGKITDLISLHEDGINSFEQLKILFNSIFPYCDDAMELLLEEYDFVEEEFKIITGKNQEQFDLRLKKDS